MSVKIQPLSEINQKATQILIREMGIVDTIRFLSQFTTGSGDYTMERERWLGDLSLDQIVSEIKASRRESA
jgi:hypothetical protein